MSAIKDFFLDLLYLTEVVLTSAGRLSSAELDRETYEILCKEYEERKARQMLWRLKKQKLLEIRERGEKVIIRLTSKGRTEALKHRIRSVQKKLPPGTWCLVSFDIPEVTKSTRWFLRDFLKQAGFKQVHQSAWCSDRAVIQELRELVRALDIEDWVKVYRAREQN